MTDDAMLRPPGRPEFGQDVRGQGRSTRPEDPEPDDRVDRYEILLLLLVALPLLATYVLCAVDALDRLVGLGIGLGVLVTLSAAQGALGASFFGLLSRECRRFAEALAAVRRAP